MTRSIIAILFTLLVASVLAAPVRHQSKQKRSFKIPRIAVKNYVPNGPRALSKAYSKFGITTPAPPPAALRKRDLKFGFGDINIVPGSDVANMISRAAAGTTAANEDGQTSATGTQNDAQFLSPITVGGQEILVNFDSGSSDAWVFNTGLPAASQKGHTLFNPAKSSTFKLLQGEDFQISYGDGSTAQGPVGTDVIDIGGSTVQNLAIGIPDKLSDSFVTDSEANGLLGLAFSKLNTIRPTQQKTFFDSVLPQLSLPVFTAQLKGSSGGSYEFGNIDRTAFTGVLQVAAIDSSNGFWEFDSNSASVNGKTININGGRAIADTGTSLMLVTDDLLTSYWGQVSGATSNDAVGGIIFPCNAKLPDLQIAVGDKMATVAGQDFNFASVGTDQTGTNFCFGGMQSNSGLPFSIYGDVFFKSNFVVFEGTAPAIGFARHA